MAVGCQPQALAALYSPETLLLGFWYSFLLEVESTRGLVRPEGLRKFKNSITLSGLEPATFWLVA
jgi:hypothetical protein